MLPYLNKITEDDGEKRERETAQRNNWTMGGRRLANCQNEAGAADLITQSAHNIQPLVKKGEINT
jgi:hypothetical protein